MPDSLSLLIVDDHPVIVEGLKALFTAEETALVFSCMDYRQTSAAIEQHQPDAVLFDLNMPKMNLERDFGHLRQKYPYVFFIAYTADSDDYTVSRCRRLGFNGFISKQEQFSRVRDSVVAIVNGRNIFPEFKPSPGSLAVPLTGAQLNVLRLIAQGQKTKEIAEALGIRDVTVDYHKRNIKEILKASTTAEAVAVAKNNRWI